MIPMSLKNLNWIIYIPRVVDSFPKQWNNSLLSCDHQFILNWLILHQQCLSALLRRNGVLWNLYHFLWIHPAMHAICIYQFRNIFVNTCHFFIFLFAFHTNSIQCALHRQQTSNQQSTRISTQTTNTGIKHIRICKAHKVNKKHY